MWIFSNCWVEIESSHEMLIGPWLLKGDMNVAWWQNDKFWVVLVLAIICSIAFRKLVLHIHAYPYLVCCRSVIKWYTPTSELYWRLCWLFQSQLVRWNEGTLLWNEWKPHWGAQWVERDFLILYYLPLTETLTSGKSSHSWSHWLYQSICELCLATVENIFRFGNVVGSSFT